MLEGNVDYSGLTNGMIVHNYKDMCEILGEPVCAGNTKIAQLKRWRRYFDYKQVGHKFRIVEIYKKPLEDISVKRNRRGVYLDCVQPLLIDILVCNKGKICVTPVELAYKLGMVNRSYLLNSRKYSDIFVFEKNNDSIDIQFEDSSLKVSAADLFYFFGKTRMKINSILNSALLSMEKHGIIKVEYGYTIRKADDSTVIADIYSETRIYKARETAAKELGIEDSISDPHNPYQRHKFYDRVNAILQKEQKWQGVYGIVMISFADGYIPPKPLSNTNRNKFKKSLNKRFLDYFTENIKSEKKKLSVDDRLNSKNRIEKTKKNTLLKPNFIAIQSDIAGNLLKL